MSAPAMDERDQIACYEPATLKPLGEVSVDTPEDVAGIIARSRAAQAAFGSAPIRKRLAVLERLLVHIVDHADELCQVVSRDAGKTLEHAMMGEIWPVSEKLKWTIANAERHLADEWVPSGPLVHKRGFITYPPRGVIGVICPWNYPLQNVMGPTISALAAGNGVVIKVSEWVAWSAARFQTIFDQALEAEGFDPSLVQLVNGYGATGAAVVSGGVDQVVFTGSLLNGRRVAHGSADAMIPCILELGGKDAFYVTDDADLDRALHAVLAGVFINAGQNCLSSERILVHEAVYDRFEGMVISAVSALRCGPPLGDERPDVGAMISPLQVEIVEELVNDAVASGARAAVGGTRLHEGSGQFFAPTVLVGVTPQMRMMNEETFGPVVLLCKVRDDEHALQIANGTEYALGSTVMCRDPVRARELARRLQGGGALVNDFGLTYMMQDLPFGGVRGSGHGRLNGRDGLRAMCATKSIMEDRLPFQQPAKVFPVGSTDYDWYRAAIQTVYRRGLAERLRGARAILTAWWRNETRDV